MAVATDFQTMQDVLDQLGGVPPSRILVHPAPGTATERDLVTANERKKNLCELVDGILVEKPRGVREALLALSLGAMIRSFVRSRKLGFVTGADGTMRLMPGLVRIPDIAFMDWRRVPGNRIPRQPVADLSPDLAVEVLSASNTKAEMDRKRAEYFDSGTTLVWLVDPDKRTITIFDKDELEPRVYAEFETIELIKVLPGFRLDLAELFGELDEHGEPTE